MIYKMTSLRVTILAVILMCVGTVYGDPAVSTSPQREGLEVFLQEHSHNRQKVDAYLRNHKGACVFRGIYGQCSTWSTCTVARAGIPAPSKVGARGCEKMGAQKYCCLTPKCRASASGGKAGKAGKGISGQCAWEKKCDGATHSLVKGIRACAPLGSAFGCCVPKAPSASTRAEETAPEQAQEEQGGGKPAPTTPTTCSFKGRPGSCTSGSECDPAQGFSWVSSRMGARGCQHLPAGIRCCAAPPPAKCSYYGHSGQCGKADSCRGPGKHFIPASSGAKGCERQPADVRCCITKTVKDNGNSNSNGNGNGDNNGPGTMKFTKAVFERMWRAYPPYPENPQKNLCITGASSPFLKKTIGGRVNRDWIVNTCAIRLSYTLNTVAERFGAGWAVPKGLKCPRRFCRDGKLNTITGERPQGNYAYRVKELSYFLNRVLGKPSIRITKADLDKLGDQSARYMHLMRTFRNRAGVIRFTVPWKDATGHFDLWNGRALSGVFADSHGRCAGHCYWKHTLDHYYKQGKPLLEVALWEPDVLPDKGFDTAKCNKAPTYAQWKAARQRSN
eukprot:TRINITY_DN3483_c0_g2_i1.p1 TRINITY_DN3483_c0_g2~~TRINITY_DN3483_c0_g2_i1.p1  ORF type:complete len:560 (-),score=115.90 TRINITY_DN3483_c0_g2_i1:66-1745(-)